jgi:hypothetical protein
MPQGVNLTQRDIDGLVLCAEHGGAPYDLLGIALGVQPARLRGITARWRRAGLADTGPVGSGPAWCWLTAEGMRACYTHGGYKPGPPRLARVTHVRAVLAARLQLTATPDWALGQPWWQSERRISRKGPFAGDHRPDAELWWPAIDASPYRDQVWALEIELTAKSAARTSAIMSAYAAAGYHRIVYYAAPAARPVVTRCAAAAPGAPVTIHDLPPAAAVPTE